MLIVICVMAYNLNVNDISIRNQIEFFVEWLAGIGRKIIVGI